MEAPEFDKDGYPTESTLDAIRSWDVTTDGIQSLIEFCIQAWYGPDMTYKNASDEYEFHTGGWSGNESIIEAMQENRLFWALSWYSSKRGGHYLFKLQCN